LSSTKNWGNRPWTVDFVAATVSFPTKVDFAIVGGGFTGLATAAWLKRLSPRSTVALFETETFGAGSSGHTGGLALAESAVGDLPGLGDVLAGYQEILRELDVEGDVALPGVFELGRSKPLKSSPMRWRDSGSLRAVKEVPGGMIDPGKTVNGLARAAERLGVALFEDAAVSDVTFGRELRLRTKKGLVAAGKILFATNAFSLELGDLQQRAQAMFTIAVATEPLSDEERQEIGVAHGKPFYTVDLPYLWGRLWGDAVIFGAGLVPTKNWRELLSLNIDEGQAAKVFGGLEKRVRGLHPGLREVPFTHRWGGPICIAEEWKPVFEHHSRSKNVIVLGAYSGHGVAQSVYLGTWAAEALLGRRELPKWS
jgi:glycine/D-amino acid oxidase-like deaminating enzyme